MLSRFALILIALIWMAGCSSEDPSSYPDSNISYIELDSEVGCGSKYSDDKKEDIFNSKYKNHWMTWRGEVVLADAESVSLNIDGKGTQDLSVDFSDKKAGYNLTKGSFINVRFLMSRMGGCFLPFSGKNAIVVERKAKASSPKKDLALNSTETESIKNSCPGSSKTIFSCLTKKGKRIQLCESGDNLIYSFGLPEKPEISLSVNKEKATTNQWTGVGWNIYYSVNIQNSSYMYSVFTSLNRQNTDYVAGVGIFKNDKFLTNVECGDGPITSELEGIELREAN
jgi:hypothetical protein